jgi:hypothetical protein
MALDPQHGGPGGAYGKMRTSNADRERAVDVLKAGFAEGRLTKEEYEQRAGQVYTSKTYEDLAKLTADLPTGPLGGLLEIQRLQRYSATPPVEAEDRTNGTAIAALVCALVPGIPWMGIILGYVARSQIRQRGERGLALANAGIAIGTFFMLIAVIYGLTRVI